MNKVQKNYTPGGLAMREQATQHTRHAQHTPLPGIAVVSCCLQKLSEHGPRWVDRLLHHRPLYRRTP